MPRKTFISYKYSSSTETRNRIINSLDGGVSYYKGETSSSPNLTDYTTNYIKEKLKDMIYDTSVTIVVISLNMIHSSWIPWEIQYSLSEHSRDNRKSKTNGIVAVIEKEITDNQILNLYDKRIFIPEIISTNMDNGYIIQVNEEDFLKYPNYYIETAYENSKNKQLLSRIVKRIKI